MKIFGDSRSGNCLKVKYVCDHLRKPYEWVEVDVLSGATRTYEFLKINPAGQVPTVLFDGSRSLAQSNAIIKYLAQNSRLLPEDPWLKAKVDEWLFWEQYSHEPAIAVVRFQVALLGWDRSDCDAERIKKGDAALDLMEQHLRKADFLVGGQLSVADIALIAYTQFAEEGGFALKSRPNVSKWLERVRLALTIKRLGSN